MFYYNLQSLLATMFLNRARNGEIEPVVFRDAVFTEHKTDGKNPHQ